VTREIGFAEVGSDVVSLQYHSRTSDYDGGLQARDGTHRARP
jgi:hypothetical protein